MKKNLTQQRFATVVNSAINLSNRHGWADVSSSQLDYVIVTEMHSLSIALLSNIDHC